MQACIGTDYLEDFVAPEIISRIEIEELSTSGVFVNQSFTIQVKFFDVQGQVVEGSKISWFSTNTQVATIDSTGKVTALQAGQTQIIATAGATLRDTLDLNVLNDPNQITAILIASSEDQNTLLVGDTLRLSITLKNADNEVIENKNVVTWHSSDEDVLTVNANGLLTALQPGQSKITAKLGNLESNEILFSVTDNVADLSKIEISAPKNQIIIGENLQFTATAFNGMGDVMLGFTFSWESDAPNILSIDNAGLAQGLQAGKAHIIAKVNDFKSQSFEVTVVDVNQVTSLEISASNNQIHVGQIVQFTAVAKNALGNVINPSSISWQSSNNNLFSVNASGLGTALNAGMVQVSATADGITSNSLTVDITAAAASRTGSFVSMNGYRVSGNATIRTEGNNLVLEFANNFSTSSGPGLYVYLSNQANNANGGIEIARLQKVSGSQTYTLPASVQLDQYNYVLIFCRPFRVVFGSALLN
ncbi:MAG: DM13 domain-containing protein [Microscillaceae bacterium]|nr:DM13 domain-containing protein [Microscillaceae bacterium]